MALFGGMFGGNAQKHPNLDRLTNAIHTSLNLQLIPPADDVLPIVDAMIGRDLIGFENARSVEGIQELFKAKSIHATVDPAAQSMTLSVASQEQIETELKAEHTAVKVLHVGGQHHSGTARIIKSFGAAPPEPVKPAATPTASLGTAAAAQQESPPVPPAFEHLEAAERLCPVIVDLFVKHGQLTSADKEVLKKIRPVDYTLEGRMTALERWKAEVSRRGRGVHVRETGTTSLLASAEGASAHSEEAVLRRFDTFVHWLSKLLKALEHKGIKFHGKPVWLPH